MKRRVFYSFHYQPDSWRASQVRNMGVVEGNQPASDNDWEAITEGGENEIEDWIDDQMHGRSCVVVLVGTNTAERKWIDYEIRKGWKDGKGVVGIRVHGLRDQDRQVSRPGKNPFAHMSIGDKSFSSIVKCYNPAGSTSQDRYAWINEDLVSTIEEAIQIRNDYS